MDNQSFKRTPLNVRQRSKHNNRKKKNLRRNSLYKEKKNNTNILKEIREDITSIKQDPTAIKREHSKNKKTKTALGNSKRNDTYEHINRRLRR